MTNIIYRCRILTVLSFSLDVSITFQSLTTIISEDIGEVQICVLLVSAASTEKEFSVELTTEEGSAQGKVSRQLPDIFQYSC